MKTILNNKNIPVRVTDEIAAKEVAKGRTYIPKRLWKEQVRDVNIKKEENILIEPEKVEVVKKVPYQKKKRS